MICVNRNNDCGASMGQEDGTGGSIEIAFSKRKRRRIRAGRMEHLRRTQNVLAVTKEKRGMVVGSHCIG